MERRLDIDGSAIGRGLILVRGGVKTSPDFTKLAQALPGAFTVYAVDRRGRSVSGPHGDGFSVDKEAVPNDQAKGSAILEIV